jgi:energy-coupling factor transporter ATP-binding protein EcfA2
LTIKPTASISKISFSGENSFQLNSNEKIILVGPNNSGKSQSLREIIAMCQNGKKERTVVVTDLEIAKTGSADDLKQFLEDKADYVNKNYRYKNWQVNADHTQFWNQEYLIHGLLPGFIKNIVANDRLTICNQQNSISPGDQKTMPQHILYDDEALMKKISDLFRRAFGRDIMFDFRGGSRLPIHVGEIPKIEGLVD